MPQELVISATVAQLTVSIRGWSKFSATRACLVVVAFVVFVVALQLFFQQYQGMLCFENIEDTELLETVEDKLFSLADFLREAEQPLILFGSCQAAEVAPAVDAGAPGISFSYITQSVDSLNLPVRISVIIGYFLKRYIRTHCCARFDR